MKVENVLRVLTAALLELELRPGNSPASCCIYPDVWSYVLAILLRLVAYIQMYLLIGDVRVALQVIE
jgi:hypothetical protein